MNKVTRGNAAQFFVAAELCRRNLVAVVTIGNTPNTDILCSNLEGTKFIHIQVKTYVPGDKTVIVGKKSENNLGPHFIWVLAGIPHPDPRSNVVPEYFIIPSQIMSENVKKAHQLWLKTPGKKGQQHSTDTGVRTLNLPPKSSYSGWSIAEYKNRWDIIEKILN